MYVKKMDVINVKRQIRNANDLNNTLMSILMSVLQEVAGKINDKLKARIDEDVYINRNNYYLNGTGTPSYEFRESVTTDEMVKGKNEVQIRIFHDKEKMSFKPDDFMHGSRYWKDGTADIREWLPKIINDGLSGDLFGENKWWQKERPYFSNTLKELESQGLIRKWFKEGLKKRGVNMVG